jgi:hypothetical protein
MKTILALLIYGVFSCFVSDIAAQQSNAIEPYNAPSQWIETFTHDDSSRSQVLVFKSVAGVSYTVQSSHDLVEWTEVAHYYGLGQEISVPMVLIAAPPAQSVPPVPETVAAPRPKFVSLLIRAASTGGIVVSWQSLDHARHIEHYLSGLTLDNAWQQYLLYMRKFDGFYFCLTHPSVVAVPKPNETLGIKDSAMIASFTSHFAEMNQEVADAVQRVRLNPPEPAPFDPNSRKFFRIVADWTLDSDSDLTLDWLEFMAMYGQNGMQPVTTALDENGNSVLITANPFGDALLPNGLPTGKIADTDQDGEPDATDVDPAEPLLNWKRSSFRYAMFPVAIPDEEQDHDRRALQTNARGQVLFRHSVWRNAVHTPLNQEGLFWGHSLAMNDHGHILGNASFPHDVLTSGNMATNSIMALCWWPEAAALHRKIKMTLPQEGDVFASMTEDHYRAGIKGEDIYGESGRFCAPTLRPLTILQPNPPPNAPVTALWNRDNQMAYSYQEIEAGHHFVKDPIAPWKLPDETETSLVDGHPVKGLISKFVTMPGGTRIACTHDQPFTRSHFRKGQEGWSTLLGLKSITDFSPTGIGITAENLAWSNRALLPLRSIAPPASDSGDLWTDYKLMDLSPLGHLLVAKEEPSSSSSIARAHSAASEGYPFSLEDNQPNTGVDNISQTTMPSDDPQNGFQEKLWVMAPQGSWLDSNGQSQNNSNEFTILAPLGDLTAEFTLDNATSNITVLTGSSTAVAFSGTGTTTTEGNMTIRMNGNTSQSFPIGIKSMKRRTVHVHIYQCQHAATVTPGQDDSYNLDIADTTEFLNRVYGSQINAYFTVTKSTLIAGQNGVPTPLYPLLNVDSKNYITLASAQQMLTEHAFPENVDIRVFAIGHDIDDNGVPANGAAPIRSNTVFFGPMRTFENLPQIRQSLAMRTLAHEIGHIMVGAGHPDELGGPAVLRGTDHTKRLMCSGNLSTHTSSCLLVKREWDKAEEWLKNRPKGDR